MNDGLRYRTSSGIKSSLDLMQEAYARCEGMDDKTKDAYLDNLGKTFSSERMKDKFHTIVMPTFGLLLLVAMIFIAFFNPFPSAYQISAYSIGIAIFAAIGAALIPGYLEIKKDGWLRAGGGLGIFVLIYFFQPETFATVSPNSQQTISVALVPQDTAAIETIDIDFDPTSNENLCYFVAKSISRYTGEAISDTAFTYYKTSDGLIYSLEKCKDVRENAILVISNVATRQFTDKRSAYLYFIGRFKTK